MVQGLAALTSDARRSASGSKGGGCFPGNDTGFPGLASDPTRPPTRPRPRSPIFISYPPSDPPPARPHTHWRGVDLVSTRDMARSKSVRALVPKRHLTHSELIRIHIRKSDRRHTEPPEELNSPSEPLAPSAMNRANISPEPARGRHTNHFTGCLSGFPLGIPFPPNGGEPPHWILPHLPSCLPCLVEHLTRVLRKGQLNRQTRASCERVS